MSKISVFVVGVALFVIASTASKAEEKKAEITIDSGSPAAFKGEQFGEGAGWSIEVGKPYGGAATAAAYQARLMRPKPGLLNLRTGFEASIPEKDENLFLYLEKGYEILEVSYHLKGEAPYKELKLPAVKELPEHLAKLAKKPAGTKCFDFTIAEPGSIRFVIKKK